MSHPMEVSPPFVNGQRQYAILVDIHTQSLLFETKKKVISVFPDPSLQIWTSIKKPTRNMRRANM